MNIFNTLRQKIRKKLLKLFVIFVTCLSLVLIIQSKLFKLKKETRYSELYERISSLPINDTWKICNSFRLDAISNEFAHNFQYAPTIYFITPTYPRMEQVAEITRLGQTLMHVENLFWIVADDNELCNPALFRLLKKFDTPCVHISSPVPNIFRQFKSFIPRDVSNRRAALSWIKNNTIEAGVLYFGNDDYTFDLRLFSEIRFTKKVSMFPVGLVGPYALSSPVVHNGSVIGFLDPWPRNQKFPVDMGGFSVNLMYLSLYPNAIVPYWSGYKENEFLKSLDLNLSDIEPKANSCTEILVWRTREIFYNTPTLKIPSRNYNYIQTNLRKLLKSSGSMGLTILSSSKGYTLKITANGRIKIIHY